MTACGFDLERAKGKGLGLISMEERVRHIGGTFSISPSPATAPASRSGFPSKQTRPPSPAESSARMKKLRLLLADDHTILLEGLKALLAPEFEVVATAGDGRAVLEAAEKHQPRPHSAGHFHARPERHRSRAAAEAIESQCETDYPHHAWGPQFCERGVRGGGIRIRVETVGGDRTGHGAS
jgi:hypothetical protein